MGFHPPFYQDLLIGSELSDLRLPLTDKNVAALPLAVGTQYVARDAELAGFFVLVGVRTKSFMIQGDLRLKGQRESTRMKIAKVALSGSPS